MRDDITKKYISHLDSIDKYHERAVLGAVEIASRSNNVFDPFHVNIHEGIAHGVIARARTAIEKISGKSSHYSQQIETILESPGNVSYKADLIVGVVRILRTDLEDGYIDSIHETIHGELFDNYLDMADYLLSAGYKDAAAVITGSTLENHLRLLCVKNGISTELSSAETKSRPKMASQINQDLGKDVYSSFDQKQVSAWLDLRNSAAHGKYENYTSPQVAQFIEWLRDFIYKYPA